MLVEWIEKSELFLSFQKENLQFLNLFGRRPDIGFDKTCKSFTISKKKEINSSYTKMKSQLKDYIDSLRVKE